MNYARQYLPGFVDGDPEEAAFSTQEELMALEWVDRWAKGDYFRGFILVKCNSAASWHESEYALCVNVEYDGKPQTMMVAFLKSKDGMTMEESPWPDYG